ncbi:hypothetical protein BV25DRAFT_1917810 [Artomyces pyxidatus]|uniref:Uncharacterized protein n=1 Tax=Artomyces pyxidatus TaxID=48021 RepID=A0ACB8SW90_9AGAM|nr:hypothetical protein BV25DRAFT_1917810 [Artomyces pyxidatus]
MANSSSPQSSTISLLSTDTTSSAFTQSKKAKKGKGKKDFFSAFTSLQTKYGFAGNAAPGAPTPSISASSSTLVSTSATAAPAPAPAAAPTPKQPPPAPKDYEAAFGALSSSFGYGASAPLIMPSKKSKKKAANTQDGAPPSS